MFPTLAMINIWDDGYVNYPDWMLIYYTHRKKCHTLLSNCYKAIKDILGCRIFWIWHGASLMNSEQLRLPAGDL